MDPILKTKKCYKCKEEKTLDCFSKDKSRSDGLGNSCKSCFSIYQKEYKERPGKKEKMSIYQKEYKEKPGNKEKMSIYFKEYKEKPRNKERSKIWHKEYYELNKEKSALASKAYRENPKNKEKQAIYFREYRENPENKRKSFLSKRKRHKERMLEDPFYKLVVLSRVQFQQLLFKRKTSSYFPYTQEELRAHIESTFESWMNWENFGNKDGCWTIDHINEVRRFYFTSIEDETFKECWSLRNLRALDAKENIRKGQRMMKELKIGKYKHKYYNIC